MTLRPLLLATVMLAVAAPGASAAVSDGWLPIYDAGDGVTLTRDHIRFGPKAAKLHRKLAGREYTSGCFGSQGTSGMDVGRVPRKRGRVEIGGGPAAEVCFLSTRLRARETACVLTTTLGLAPGERPWCARVILAADAAGHAYLDDFARGVEVSALFFAGTSTVAELQKRYGSDVVALAAPDAAPPAGKVGIFDDGHTRVSAAVLANGTRRFVRSDGDVFSTNVERLVREPEWLTLP